MQFCTKAISIGVIQRSKARIYPAELIVTAERAIPGLVNPGIKLADLAHTLCGGVGWCRRGAVLEYTGRSRVFVLYIGRRTLATGLNIWYLTAELIYKDFDLCIELCGNCCV